MNQLPTKKTFCRSKNIDILSLAEFRRKIIDASQYLELRSNHSFGSANDPDSESQNLSDIRYQSVGITDLLTGQTSKIDNILDALNKSQQVILLGDYGMGKSTTIWQVYTSLRNQYVNSKGSSPVPVVLNLREHWGQDDPSEALVRHAEKIGFKNPEQLTRALNAGRLIILLDGFDEVGTSPWSRSPQERLKQLRIRAVHLVKKFAERTRGKCGFLVAGREHFFDNINELLSALGLDRSTYTFKMDEFSIQEAQSFLSKYDITQDLPDWLPKRPLLLASLVARKHLDAVLEASNEIDPATAWDRLVDIICKREAAIHKILDERGIRRILETLATQARETADGLGPITEDHIADAFRLETGSYPDATAFPLLQRLPGLSIRNSDNGHRSFLDDQMLDVLRGSTVAHFIDNPWKDPQARRWQHGLRTLGLNITANKLPDDSIQTISRIQNSMEQAQLKWEAPTLALDILQLIRNLKSNIDSINLENLTITEGYIDVLDLTIKPSPEQLRLNQCEIGELSLPMSPIKNLTINECLIHRIIGISDTSSIPSWITDSDVMILDDFSTNSKIMDDHKLPLPIRVMMTIIRKIYYQKGQGRKLNALYRGIDKKAQPYVDDVLQILYRHKIAFSVRRKSEVTWHPVAGQKKRVSEIIDSVTTSNDPVVIDIRKL